MEYGPVMSSGNTYNRDSADEMPRYIKASQMYDDS
jgi:hypothetical protein